MVREMASKAKMVALLLGMCTVLGCASSGRNFNSQNLAQLEPGQTSFDQAQRILGAPPVQTVLAPSGNSVSYWRFIRVGFAGNTGLREAGLVFKPDGTFVRILQLQNIELSQRDRQRLMTLPASANSTPAAPVANAQPGQSREQQLQELNNAQGLSYEEYQRRYREIVGQ